MRNQTSGSRRKSAGLTLVELLVVVAIIGLLASVMLPGLAQAKAKAQGTSCQNNLRQLQLAWFMYADDHEGKLVPNSTSGKPQSGWVGGDMSSSQDRTDATLIQNGLLGPYARDIKIYKCPVDASANLRSFAMNSRMAGQESQQATGSWQLDPIFELYKKQPDVRQPNQYFVFIDERSDTLASGCFRMNLTYAYWNLMLSDYPAANHNRGGCISFADGHTESHRWRDSRTMPANAQTGTLSPVNKDYTWLMRHAASPADGSDWPCDDCVVYVP